MPSPNPNLKVKDEDNMFDASDILNAKRACLLHIVQKHKDVWIDHRGELIEG
jgi:hypothetical protein